MVSSGETCQELQTFHIARLQESYCSQVSLSALGELIDVLRIGVLLAYWDGTTSSPETNSSCCTESSTQIKGVVTDR